MEPQWIPLIRFTTTIQKIPNESTYIPVLVKAYDTIKYPVLKTAPSTATQILTYKKCNPFSFCNRSPKWQNSKTMNYKNAYGPRHLSEPTGIKPARTNTPMTALTAVIILGNCHIIDGYCGPCLAHGHCLVSTHLLGYTWAKTIILHLLLMQPLRAASGG